MHRNRSNKSFIFALFVIFCCPLAAFAQTVRNAAKLPTDRDVSAAAAREPFAVGETLNYEGEYSRAILRGIDVANLTFKVLKAPNNSPDGAKFLLQGEAISKGTLLKLARFSFLQKIDSTVEVGNFRILQTVRRDEQNKRIRDGEAVFDYKSNKVTYREIDPNNPANPPRVITSRLEASVQDILSAIYFLRRQPLAVGKNFEISVSDSGVIYRVPVKITAREQIRTALGKLWTLRVEPEVFGEKRLIQDEGKMILWLTDDARRLPVRSQIQSSFGKVEIKLKSAQGLQPVN